MFYVGIFDGFRLRCNQKISNVAGTIIAVLSYI